MYHAMTIFGFTFDSLAQRPMVLLKDDGDRSTVPLWLNTMEAMAIATELVGRDVSAQLGRQDLLATVLEGLGIAVQRVTLDCRSAGGFTGTLVVSQHGEKQRLTLKPSEALILALKNGLPVMVSDRVLAQASLQAFSDEQVSRETDARRFIDFLEHLEPAEMGKYPM